MADVQIDQDAANIPAVNVVNGVADPSAPGSGHAKLYVKDGVLYVRLDTGAPVAVGGVVTLAEGQLAIGDGDDALSALGLGTEGDVVTADASGFATWAAPAAPGGGGDLVKLATITVGAGGAASADFTDIDQTYSHLRVDFLARSEKAAANEDHRLWVNNDQTNNYWYHGEWYWGTSSGSEGSTLAGYIRCYWIAGTSTQSTFWTQGSIYIPFYTNTVSYKYAEVKGNCRVGTNNGTDQYSFGGYGYWKATTAISRLTFTAASSNLVEGSTYILYGIK